MSTIKEQNKVSAVEEYILGPEGIPFFTKRWFPTDTEPKAYLLFCHGFAEHIQRYDAFFRLLAAPPYALHVFAFDKRGHGRTSQQPMDAKAPQYAAWKQDGKTVALQKGMRGRNGGWAKAMPDMEWFVQRESERAKSKGKKLFLYGHSMGGGEVLGFASRKTPPPSPETVKLLAGVIASGPFIRSAVPINPIQSKVGTLAANIGLGNFLINTPLDIKMLTHDPDIVEKTGKDPMCQPVGSLRTAADMLSGGDFLDSRASWDAWPEDLPLLLYHGGEDAICCPKAAVRFGDRVVAKDKTTKILEGLYHEPHNELAPAPANLAKLVAEWVLKRAGEDEVQAKL